MTDALTALAARYRAATPVTRAALESQLLAAASARQALLAELIEDVRRDGVSDAELEPLFKSAEGYLRMWEKAESRAAALRP